MSHEQGNNKRKAVPHTRGGVCGGVHDSRHYSASSGSSSGSESDGEISGACRPTPKAADLCDGGERSDIYSDSDGEIPEAWPSPPNNHYTSDSGVAADGSAHVPINLTDILAGDTLRCVVPYLNMRDLSRTKIVSKLTHDCIELFKAYGDCIFHNRLLSFDTERDRFAGRVEVHLPWAPHIKREDLPFQGGIVGQSGLDSGRYQLHLNIPNTTQHVIFQAGLKRIYRNDSNVYDSDEDVDEQEEEEGLSQDEEDDEEEGQASNKISPRDETTSIFAFVNITPTNITVDGPYGMPGVQLPKRFEREEEQDYTFLFSYSDTPFEKTLLRVECSDLSFIPLVNASTESQHFYGPFSWFIAMGPSKPSFASNVSVEIRFR